MKRVFILSGIVFLLMTLLVFTGRIRLNHSMRSSINSGNAYYNDKDYGKAIEIYERVLKNKPNNADILYNIGLTAYAMEDYEKAIEYYSQSRDCSMLLGNAYYRQGSRIGDPTQQMQSYRQGLEQYLISIKAEPNNIEVKYNYELLKKLIDDREQNQEQQNEKQKDENSQDKDQSQDSQKDKNQQNQDGQNEENENQKQENQNKENDDRNNQNSEEQKNDQKKLKNEREDGQSQNNQNEAFNDEEANQNQNSIDQVLKMLEQQEKQSLKNNQAVMNKGEGEVNDW